jgi:hypothetical protein
VSHWHKADIGLCAAHVCFVTQSDITNHSTVRSKADIAWDLFQCLPLNSDVIGSHEVAHLP